MAWGAPILPGCSLHVYWVCPELSSSGFHWYNWGIFVFCPQAVSNTIRIHNYTEAAWSKFYLLKASWSEPPYKDKSWCQTLALVISFVPWNGKAGLEVCAWDLRFCLRLSPDRESQGFLCRTLGVEFWGSMKKKKYLARDSHVNLLGKQEPEKTQGKQGMNSGLRKLSLSQGARRTGTMKGGATTFGRRAHSDPCHGSVRL